MGSKRRIPSKINTYLKTNENIYVQIKVCHLSLFSLGIQSLFLSHAVCSTLFI